MRPLLVAVVLAAACGSPAPQRPAAAPSTAAPLTPPAEMSHGEAPVGAATTKPDRAADAPPRSSARRHRIRMTSVAVRHEVSTGVWYDAWTFDSIVPGPVLRATVGDTIEFTLVNGANMPHSMDFHAAEIAPNRAYRNVNPKDSIQFTFVPRVPGAFMYHCGTAPVAAHIANGMYGALIIDPVSPRPAAQEFVLVQSEFYMGAGQGKDSLRALDWQKLLGASPDFVTFNGVASRYATHPIAVKPRTPIRLYVVNAGPNRTSSFHVVGAIFDAIYADAFGSPLKGVQTYNVPVGGGAIFELRLAEPGVYPFVSHAFADATKGAMGVLEAAKR
ncbi:MAG TPA: multicopper oxidase domain-containing protein [Gemmatimonadaceae bacterium]|jgi:nitrite reductase (NO-forming)